VTIAFLLQESVKVRHFLSLTYHNASNFETDLNCWEVGRCLGVTLTSIEHNDELECQNLCYEDDDCNWFTYDVRIQECTLYSTCPRRDAQCTSCVSGHKICGARKGMLCAHMNNMLTINFSKPPPKLLSSEVKGRRLMSTSLQ